MYTLIKTQPVERLLGRYPTLEQARYAAVAHAVNSGGFTATIFDPDGLPVEGN
ncbi:hypothetical protein LCGC14_2747030 [marine sediment metagenome]|uniref:Uncharacterized protein n=1 Tax=marine sediment metagenome TaxID=412755 RepID=A0A0F9BBN1_9ZZZZ